MTRKNDVRQRRRTYAKRVEREIEKGEITANTLHFTAIKIMQYFYLLFISTTFSVKLISNFTWDFFIWARLERLETLETNEIAIHSSLESICNSMRRGRESGQVLWNIFQLLVEHLNIKLNPCQAFIIPCSGFQFSGAMCQRQRIKYSTRWYFSFCWSGFQFTLDVECRKLVLTLEEQIFFAFPIRKTENLNV